MPSEAKILFILDSIKKTSRKGIEAKTDSERINKMIAWNSRSVMKQLQQRKEDEPCCRVAVSDTYTCAFFTHGRNCKYSRNCIYDCQGKYIGGVRKRRKVKKGRVCPFSRDGTKIFLAFPVEEFKNRGLQSVISNTRQNAKAFAYTISMGKGVRNWESENHTRKKK